MASSQGSDLVPSRFQRAALHTKVCALHNVVRCFCALRNPDRDDAGRLECDYSSSRKNP
jgi:hypothetical protein